MNNSNPAYAILRTKGQLAPDLLIVGAHNDRSIPAVSAHPDVKNGVRILRLNGDDTLSAVMERIEKAGAKRPGAGRIHAFEAVVGLSPNADHSLTETELPRRAIEFFDDQFGAENVVGIWQHDDEKTRHIHALIVPVCEGYAPGRPHKNQPRRKIFVVSWNQFSGSCDRKYRRDRDPTPNRSNPVMGGWQTEWAARWAGCGISRGIPSTRTHLPMEWVRGQQGEIIAQAREAVSLREPVKLNPDQFTQLQENPSVQVLTNLVSELVTRELKERIKPLIELANRGIQLETERQARADIESRYQESQIEVMRLKSRLSGAPTEAELRIENEHLKGEIERLNWALEDGETERGKQDPHEIFHQSGRPPPRGPDCQREQNI